MAGSPSNRFGHGATRRLRGATRCRPRAKGGVGAAGGSHRGLGGHIQACPEGHVERVWYHACRHRRCPPCAWLQVERWLAPHKARLLACDHYHVLVTMPDERRELGWRNVRAMTTLVCATVHETLVERLGDAKSLGARPESSPRSNLESDMGLAPASALPGDRWWSDGEGQWRAARNGFLRPVRVVMAVFRGKRLAGHRYRRPPGTAHAARREAPMGSGTPVATNWAAGRGTWTSGSGTPWRGVLTYLARYIRGGPRANQRLVACATGRGQLLVPPPRGGDRPPRHGAS